jgi:hypothetical protein
VGVLALKNFSQFAVIYAAASPVAVADALADAAGDDELDVVDDEPELLQPTTAAASARPSNGARMTRGATSWNRIARSLASISHVPLSSCRVRAES